MPGDDFVQCRVAVGSNINKVVLVQIANEELDSNILEDDIITVEGRSMGNTEYTTVLGSTISVPAMAARNVIR